jgi:hypothetical protein
VPGGGRGARDHIHTSGSSTPTTHHYQPHTHACTQT